MKSVVTLIVIVIIAAVIVISEPVHSQAAAQNDRITIRTEIYPRPPYSGATYYIYERGGEVVCTKLRVCNKYDNCETEYRKGSFKEDEDVRTGDPFDKTGPVAISSAKLKKHVCLTRFKLVK